MKKQIKTQLGIIEISKTSEKVSYKYGNRYYTRMAWIDNSGGVWVRFCNQFNLLRKIDAGYFPHFEMWLCDPCGN